jgi:hypothetical protein
MRTVKMFPIHKEDWMFVVDKFSTAPVWCIQDVKVKDGSLQGVLCYGSKAEGTDVGIDFVKLFDTFAEAQADIYTEALSTTSVPRQVSWAALGMEWRGVFYKEKFRCLMGGQGWFAQSLTWSPGHGDVVSDPYTMAVGMKLNGSVVTVDDAVVLGSDTAQVLFIAQENNYDTDGDVEWICKPLFEWSIDFEQCQLLMTRCNLRTALYANTHFLEKVAGKDPEESMIERMGNEERN